MKQKIPRHRLIVESTVIVGSILLAFVIDAWWDTRKEYAEEQIALIDLRNELQENLAAIENDWIDLLASPIYASAVLLRQLYGLPIDSPTIDLTISRIEAGEDYAEVLFDFYNNEVLVPIADADLASDEIDVRARTIENIRRAPTYGPTIASLDVLFQSGMVNRIQSEELRSKLTAMPIQLNDYNTEEEILSDFVLSELRRQLEVSVIEFREIALLSVGQRNTGKRESIQDRLIRISPSKEVVYALAERIDFSLRVIRQLEIIKTQYEEVVMLINRD